MVEVGIYIAITKNSATPGFAVESGFGSAYLRMLVLPMHSQQHDYGKNCFFIHVLHVLIVQFIPSTLI